MKKEFDREDFRRVLKKMTSFTDEQIEFHLNEQEGRERNLKSGDNVLSLQYYDRYLPQEEIGKLITLLEPSNVELSYYDKTGVIQASVMDYLVHLYVTTAILDEVLKNVVWDSISYAILRTISLVKADKADNKNKAVGFTFNLSNSSGDQIRKLSIDISPEMDAAVAAKALQMIPSVVKFTMDERDKTIQQSRYLKETVTFAPDGTIEFSRFESPERFEETPVKKKKSEKKTSSKSKKKEKQKEK